MKNLKKLVKVYTLLKKCVKHLEKRNVPFKFKKKSGVVEVRGWTLFIHERCNQLIFDDGKSLHNISSVKDFKNFGW